MPKPSIKTKFHTERHLSYQEILTGMCAAALLSAFFPALLIPAFPSVSGHWVFYAVVGGLLGGLFYLFLCVRQNRWFTPALSLGMIAVFLIASRRAKNGILLLANDFLRFQTGRTGRIFNFYRTDGTAGNVLIPCIYIVLLALAAANLIRRRKYFIFPILFLLSLPGFAAGFFKDSYPAVLLLLLASAVSLFPCGMPAGKMRGPAKNALANLLPPILAALITLLLCGVVYISSSGEPLDTENGVRNLLRTAHRMRYENKTAEALLPEGNLTDLPALSAYSEKSPERPKERPGRRDTKDTAPVLTVTTETPEKIYLRGFTGDCYENSVWKGAASDSNISNAARFHTLHENGFYAQTQIAASAAASLSTNIPENLTASIRIENNAACTRYRYLPYGLTDAGLLDARAIGDASVYAADSSADDRNRTVSELSCIAGGLPAWYDIELALASESYSEEAIRYLQLEQAYFEYVENTDLQLPGETAAVMGVLFGTEPKKRELSEILDLVRKALAQNLRYDESAGAPWLCMEDASSNRSAVSSRRKSNGSNLDFIAETLRTSHRGYDIHYAACATAMLRYLGVPARYVEGFYLSGDEAAAITPGSAYTLDASHAHAWAEFYLRGIGWIPFETTPGYEDNEEFSLLTQLTRKASASSGDAAFAQFSLLYTSGVHNSMPLPDSGPSAERSWNPAVFIFLLLAVLLVSLFVMLRKLLLRRVRLRSAVREMKNAGNNQAVALQFAYAKMLMKEAGLTDIKGLSEMKLLNEKALFSREKLSAEDAETAAAFTGTVIRACREKWNGWEYFRNHFIRWIV